MILCLYSLRIWWIGFFLWNYIDLTWAVVKTHPKQENDTPRNLTNVSRIWQSWKSKGDRSLYIYNLSKLYQVYVWIWLIYNVCLFLVFFCANMFLHFLKLTLVFSKKHTEHNAYQLTNANLTTNWNAQQGAQHVLPNVCGQGAKTVPTMDVSERRRGSQRQRCFKDVSHLFVSGFCGYVVLEL